MMTPEQFVRVYTGQAIAYDGPRYGVQCVGGFKVWCNAEGIPVVPCPNDWAESYWTCLNEYGQIDASVASWQKKYFTKITDWRDFRNGDWVIWPRGCASHPQSHIAMYYDGKEFGQRQYEDNRAFCLKSTNFTDAYGALRWKGYEGMIEIPAGHSIVTINDHKYEIRRMCGVDQINVLSVGLNKVGKIQEFDADVLISSKITAGNFYQAKHDQTDPYGTTYGDISAPLSGVYQSLPNQDQTLFYDLDTGLFGDGEGVQIDPTHNVFSPVLVYPNSKGNWEYARMVGLGHIHTKSWYTFVVKFADGYATVLAMQEMTPQEIADDWSMTDMINLAIGDGGASAQAAFWYDDAMHYVRDINTPTASAIVISRPFTNTVPIETPEASGPAVSQPESAGNADNPSETGKDDKQPMTEENVQNQIVVQPVENWTDPEAGKTTFKDRLIAMLSIKSLLTLTGNGVFLYLTCIGKIAPEVFMAVFSSEVAFYFGTTFQKGGKQ